MITLFFKRSAIGSIPTDSLLPWIESLFSSSSTDTPPTAPSLDKMLSISQHQAFQFVIDICTTCTDLETSDSLDGISEELSARFFQQLQGCEDVDVALRHFSDLIGKVSRHIQTQHPHRFPIFSALSQRVFSQVHSRHQQEVEKKSPLFLAEGTISYGHFVDAIMAQITIFRAACSEGFNMAQTGASKVISGLGTLCSLIPGVGDGAGLLFGLGEIVAQSFGESQFSSRAQTVLAVVDGTHHQSFFVSILQELFQGGVSDTIHPSKLARSIILAIQSLDKDEAMASTTDLCTLIVSKVKEDLHFQPVKYIRTLKALIKAIDRHVKHHTQSMAMSTISSSQCSELEQQMAILYLVHKTGGSDALDAVVDTLPISTIQALLQSKPCQKLGVLKPIRKRLQQRPEINCKSLRDLTQCSLRDLLDGELSVASFDRYFAQNPDALTREQVEKMPLPKAVKDYVIARLLFFTDHGAQGFLDCLHTSDLVVLSQISALEEDNERFDTFIRLALISRKVGLISTVHSDYSVGDVMADTHHRDLYLSPADISLLLQQDPLDRATPLKSLSTSDHDQQTFAKALADIFEDAEAIIDGANSTDLKPDTNASSPSLQPLKEDHVRRQALMTQFFELDVAYHPRQFEAVNAVQAYCRVFGNPRLLKQFEHRPSLLASACNLGSQTAQFSMIPGLSTGIALVGASADAFQRHQVIAHARTFDRFHRHCQVSRHHLFNRVMLTLTHYLESSGQNTEDTWTTLATTLPQLYFDGLVSYASHLKSGDPSRSLDTHVCAITKHILTKSNLHREGFNSIVAQTPHNDAIVLLSKPDHSKLGQSASLKEVETRLSQLHSSAMNQGATKMMNWALVSMRACVEAHPKPRVFEQLHMQVGRIFATNPEWKSFFDIAVDFLRLCIDTDHQDDTSTSIRTQFQHMQLQEKCRLASLSRLFCSEVLELQFKNLSLRDLLVIECTYAKATALPSKFTFGIEQVETEEEKRARKALFSSEEHAIFFRQTSVLPVFSVYDLSTINTPSDRQARAKHYLFRFCQEFSADYASNRPNTNLSFYFSSMISPGLAPEDVRDPFQSLNLFIGRTVQMYRHTLHRDEVSSELILLSSVTPSDRLNEDSSVGCFSFLDAISDEHDADQWVARTAMTGLDSPYQDLCLLAVYFKTGQLEKLHRIIARLELGQMQALCELSVCFQELSELSCQDTDFIHYLRVEAELKKLDTYCATKIDRRVNIRGDILDSDAIDMSLILSHLLVDSPRGALKQFFGSGLDFVPDDNPLDKKSFNPLYSIGRIGIQRGNTFTNMNQARLLCWLRRVLVVHFHAVPWNWTESAQDYPMKTWMELTEAYSVIVPVLAPPPPHHYVIHTGPQRYQRAVRDEYSDTSSNRSSLLDDTTQQVPRDEYFLPPPPSFPAVGSLGGDIPGLFQGGLESEEETDSEDGESNVFHQPARPQTQSHISRMTDPVAIAHARQARQYYLRTCYLTGEPLQMSTWTFLNGLQAQDETGLTEINMAADNEALAHHVDSHEHLVSPHRSVQQIFNQVNGLLDILTNPYMAEVLSLAQGSGMDMFDQLSFVAGFIPGLSLIMGISNTTVHILSDQQAKSCYQKNAHALSHYMIKLGGSIKEFVTSCLTDMKFDLMLSGIQGIETPDVQKQVMEIVIQVIQKFATEGMDDESIFGIQQAIRESLITANLLHPDSKGFESTVQQHKDASLDFGDVPMFQYLKASDLDINIRTRRRFPWIRRRQASYELGVVGA